MKKLLLIISILIGILVIMYFAGPKVGEPTFKYAEIELPNSLAELEEQIVADESSTKGLRPDNEARIVWSDSEKKEKTKIAILYLHGFTASQIDGSPVHTNIAKKYNANLYLFRNAHHGIDLGDSTMINSKTDDFIYAAEKALAIARKLGDEVIVMGNSFGGDLTLYLASRHPEIKSIILYAPAIRSTTSGAELVTGPWGYQMLKLIVGSEYLQIENPTEEVKQYFNTHTHINAALAGASFVYSTMQPETFQKINCPVFLGYYYKNEKEQDDEASVDAMIKMFNELGTPDNLKRKVSFPNAGSHVIGSFITSKSYTEVQLETEKFLEDIVFNE